MSEPFVFDPNDMDAFTARWMADVGNLHLGHKYNGWAFFNPQRELLDVYIGDIDGHWIDTEFDINASPHGPWDAVIARAKAVGATDVIAVHTHLAEEPDGPCSDIGGFAAAGTALLHDAGIELRVVVILHADELDGALFVTPIEIDQQMRGLRDPLAEMGEQVLANLQSIADTGDPIAAKLASVVEKIQERLRVGQTPDPALLLEALRLTREARQQIIEPESVNPLSLPMFNLKDRGLLN